MPDKTTDPDVPQVRDRRTAPPGILPKNIQAWIVSGIAAVMVAVIALSGGNPPKGPAPPASAVIDPNAARIQEYQKRIEEQARKLQLEQAQLARSQQVLQDAASTAPQVSNNVGPRSGRSSPGASSIRTEREKREYESLFASNIALSYRKETSAQKETPAPDDAAKMLPLYSALAALQSIGPSSGPALPPVEVPGVGPTATPIDKQGTQNRPQESPGNETEVKKHRLFEGTVIETVLTNRLDGAFSGPVNCMVTTSIYSRDGQHLLIPQGSRVLGEVRQVDSFGQERLAVSFHRLIMPDGFSVNFDTFQGLNQIGETGLRDKVNRHYLQVFGVSVAIGAIAGLAEGNARTGPDQSPVDAYQQGVATSLSQSSLRILDRYLNVLPTFTIREGHRVKVYLSSDVLLPAYDQHRVQ